MLDPVHAASILEPIEVLGVDAFKASEVTLRFRIKTVPLKQWEVGRELRRRIKKSFDAAGIRIPGQQLQITMKRQ
jgi:small conductance mechanosensitive channel